MIRRKHRRPVFKVRKAKNMSGSIIRNQLFVLEEDGHLRLPAARSPFRRRWIDVGHRRHRVPFPEIITNVGNILMIQLKCSVCRNICFNFISEPSDFGSDGNGPFGSISKNSSILDENSPVFRPGPAPPHRAGGDEQASQTSYLMHMDPL